MSTQDDRAQPIHVNRERATVELCGIEHEGSVCVRDRGHEGRHEILSVLARLLQSAK